MSMNDIHFDAIGVDLDGTMLDSFLAVIADFSYCEKLPPEMGGNAVIDSLDELISALKTL